MIFQCKENNIIIDSANDVQNADELDENKSPPPVYKDIDPFIKYRLEDIKRIHERILSIIDVMNNLTTNKMENIQYYRTDVALGFSLIIFLQTLEYEISLIQGQIQLFVNYILFYHSSQRTYLEKLLKKIELFATEMQNIVLIPYIVAVSSASIACPGYSNLEYSPNITRVLDNEKCSNITHDIDYYEENDTESFQPVLALETLYTQCPLQAKLATDTVTQDYQAKPVRLGLHKTEEAVIHNPVSGDIREHDTPNHESVENVTIVDEDSVSSSIDFTDRRSVTSTDDRGLCVTFGDT